MTSTTWRKVEKAKKPRAVCLTASVATLTAALAVGGVAQRSGLPLPFTLIRSGVPGGHAPQGYLGVNLRDIPDEQLPLLKLSNNPSQPRGAEIFSVDHDGPAGKAGLREHDVILQMNGQAVEGGESLRRMLREIPAGRSVTFVVSRAGQQQTVLAQMANREDVERQAWEHHLTVPDPQPPEPPPPAPADRHSSGFFSSPGRASRNFIGGIVLSPGYTGAILEAMAPQLAEFFGTQGRQGLLVSSVDANSPAELAGLRAGDVVVRVNAADIVTNGDWLRAVRENKGKSISVIVLRDRHEQTLTMIPNARHHSSLFPEHWRRFGSNSASLSAIPASTPRHTDCLPDPFTMI